MLNGYLTPLEIVLLRKVSHLPGVVKMIEWFCEPEGFIIVMEYFESSVDLYTLVSKDNELSEDLARHFFCQLLYTVFYMFEAGVVHRDIKSENIVVDLKTMTVKLIDFGFADHFSEEYYNKRYYKFAGKYFDNFKNCCLFENNQKLFIFLGTLFYAPPEWYNNGSFQPYSSTVWSLGMVLFDMLNATTLIRGHLNAALPRQTTSFLRLSGPCQHLVVRCLGTDPTDRIELEDIVRHPWVTQKY